MKRMILYCIIFETNKRIYRNGYLRGWLFTVKVIVGKGGLKFFKISKGRKSETAMTHLNKT